jgi:hypothetical protein
MQNTRIFGRNFAGFLPFFLAACGSPQTPQAASNASSAVDAGLLAAFSSDASAPDPSASNAGLVAAMDAGAPIATTPTDSNDTTAPDPCAKPSSDFEQLVRPKFNECYQAGKKKNPNLTGEIRVTLSFDYKGKITSIKHTGNDDLGKPVIACMVDAVKKTTFPNPDVCPRKSIVVGKKFGEPAKGTITAD